MKKRINDLIYALKIAMSDCRRETITFLVTKTFANVLKFVFDVYYLSLLLEMIVEGAEWNGIGNYLLIGCLVVVLKIFFDNMSEYSDFMLSIKITPKIRSELYKKSVSYKLQDLQNQQYLNEYSMVLKNTASYIQKSVTISSNIISVFFYLIFLAISLLAMDKIISITLIILLAYHYLIFSRQHARFADLIYSNECDKNPYIRKKEYFKRLFYLKPFAYNLKEETVFENIMVNYNRNMEDYISIDKKCKRKELRWNVLVNGYGNLYSSMIVVAILVVVLKARDMNSISIYWQVYQLFLKFYGLYFFRMGGELEALSKHIQQFRNFLKRAEYQKGSQIMTAGPSIEIKNMSFHYNDNDSFRISNFNMNVKSGEKVAIVGRNGSGKSTLFSLLLGLLEPEEGTISFNGKDMGDYNLYDGTNVGVVCQNFNVYSIKIKDNITMGEDSYLPENIIDALKNAGGKDILESLDKGIDTFLGSDINEGAIELSGGQAQRIALGRIMLSTAPYILLDEPTASIDPIYEKEIMDNLMTCLDTKTTVMITHRLDITRYFDRIIVMDNGRIIEEGTFDNLVSRPTMFRDMYYYQMGITNA